MMSKGLEPGFTKSPMSHDVTFSMERSSPQRRLCSRYHGSQISTMMLSRSSSTVNDLLTSAPFMKGDYQALVCISNHVYPLSPPLQPRDSQLLRWGHRGEPRALELEPNVAPVPEKHLSVRPALEPSLLGPHAIGFEERDGFLFDPALQGHLAPGLLDPATLTRARLSPCGIG